MNYPRESETSTLLDTSIIIARKQYIKKLN